MPPALVRDTTTGNTTDSDRVAVSAHATARQTQIDSRAATDATASEPAATIMTDAARHTRLRLMVDSHLDFVARILRNAGTPESQIDDEVQRTFIVASNRLNDIVQGSEKSFLAQTALHLAAHARRTVARRREVQADESIELIEALATPEDLTDQKRVRQMLDRVLDQMEPNLRTVFVLHEFEQMNMAEIANVLSIPRGTVASRLRRARFEFRERVRAIDQNVPGGTQHATQWEGES
jgi:RNA polymerase sigma-70 factor (ECF subfamily)